MRRFIMIAMALAMIVMLVACSAQEPETEPTPTPTEEPTPTPTPTEEPTTTPDPSLSRTTGLPFDGEYQPVMVVIENSAVARPQRGLQTADIVYEVPVEGGITRFVCLFSDNVPDAVMPIRSVRPTFLYIQSEWDAIFMHFGGSGRADVDLSKPYSAYGHHLYSEIKIVLDGLGSGWGDYFQRVSSASAPHNVEGNPLLAQALYDYEPESPGWLFESGVTYSGEDSTEFSLAMCSGDADYITYTYDPENDVYLRSMNGKAFTSAETGEQVSVTNVIVQYSTYTTVEGIKLWDMIGSGDADFYIGGKKIEGSWERESESDVTVFYDDEGNQIVLRPGNTWVHIHPEL